MNKEEKVINVKSSKEAVDKLNVFSKDFKKINKKFINQMKKLESDKGVK